VNLIVIGGGNRKVDRPAICPSNEQPAPDGY